MIGAWLRAWWSFLHGRDGLSDWDAVERNMIVIVGNLVVVLLLYATMLVMTIAKAVK